MMNKPDSPTPDGASSQITAANLIGGGDPRTTTSGIRIDVTLPERASEAEEIPFDGDSVEIALDDEDIITEASPPAIDRLVADNEGSSRPWLDDRGEFAHGGMSRLHRVHHHKLRRTDAMKILDEKAVSGAGARLRFIEEAQITGQLDHPNIPPVHDFWRDEQGSLRFTMKLVQGDTLTQRLAAKALSERTDRDWERLLEILLKVCDAIAFAHSHGVVHRDIKPDNIMVGSHGQVYVMDWGCIHLLPGAKLMGLDVERDSKTTLDPPLTALGTAAYMSPEQATATVKALDERTDVYLIGGVLHEMLTGKPPHPQATMAEAILSAQRDNVMDPQEVVGSGARLPLELCRIAKKALARRRSERYASVEDLKAELEEAIRVGWWFASKTFADGELVVREGEEADAAYIITAGACEVFRMEGGKRVFLRKMGPGDAFGETALLTTQTRTASVQATGSLTTTVITKDAFDHAFDDSWLRPFVSALAQRFKELDERFAYIRMGGK